MHRITQSWRIVLSVCVKLVQIKPLAMSWQGLNDESNPRTLYVGNLDASVSEDLICALFSQIGSVKGCKIIRELSALTFCQPGGVSSFHSQIYLIKIRPL
ncbi:hypothetical protein B566_EDAN010384 [Ephemera danica]|nr:hypothetical protein B566_EDAN010384 [Ephemera danica]